MHIELKEECAGVLTAYLLSQLRYWNPLDHLGEMLWNIRRKKIFGHLLGRNQHFLVEAAPLLRPILPGILVAGR